LRKKIGDQAFFQALENYYQENKYQIATPDDLKGAFEQTYGQSLEDFYQEWLYSPKP
jgi:aminopeptidase N